MHPLVRRFRPRFRRLVTRSWWLSSCYYRYRSAHLIVRPRQEIWYFAYGANMDDNTFRIRRRLQPLECRPGRVASYRLRFNLDGRPKGRSAPANLCPDPDAEVWGVLYRITRRDLMLLDTTEGYRDAATVILRSRPKIVMAAQSTPPRTWPRARRSTAVRHQRL